MKRLLLILLSAILLGNSYSQNTESSFFRLNQVAGDDSKIRAKSPTQIVSVSFSIETGNEIFTFIKNADTMIYATVPYGYTINDFVVLDSCIFFCGKNILDSCGYIGIFDVTVATLNIGGYRFVNIEKTAELNKIVAYNVYGLSNKFGAVAIGKPNISGFKSSVVDLNNYLQNSWTYTVGLTKEDYITDISLVGSDNGEVVTVGQSLVLNPNQNNFVSAYLPKMYIRTYKRDAVFTSGMEDVLNEYRNVRISPTSPFKVSKLNNYSVAVSAIVGKSGMNHFIPPIYGLETKRISLSSMEMDKIQFVNNVTGSLKEVTYFPSYNKMVILSEDTMGTDEMFFVDLNKTVDYASHKIYRDNISFNSIVSYDNTHFLATGLEHNLITSRLSVLQENINNFSTSECVVTKSTQVTNNEVSIYPNDDSVFCFTKQSYLAEFEIGFATIYETTVNLKCINYYK